MTLRWLTSIALVLAVFWAPLVSRADGDTPINSYTVVALGDLGGGNGSTARGLNDAGQVVGSSRPPIGGVTVHAFLWQDGAMTDLGTLGGPDSQANAINNSGQVVGWATTAGPGYVVRAFLWDATSGMRDLGTLGGSGSSAYAINDAGQVVGGAQNAAGADRAFLWQNGRMYDLGVPTGYVSSRAYGINASGQVVGHVTDAYGRTRAFRWTPSVPNGTTGTMVALPQTTVDEAQYAYAVNSAGAVAGESRPGYASRPTAWGSGGGVYHLPFLYYMDYGYAFAINDAGYVVGQNSYDYWDEFNTYTDSSAFLWDAVNGTRDLGALTGSGHINTFEQARGINTSGQVIANAYGAAYLLHPSPVPPRPAHLSAGTGDARVHLSWGASPSASHYTVRRSTSGSAGPFAPVATGVTGTTWSDANVVNGTTYYYVVSASNEWGESLNSPVAYATPVPLPAPPAGLTATAGNQQVSLAWNPSATASHYSVYRATSSGGPYTSLGYVTETSLTDPGFVEGGIATGEWWPLQNGATYYYVVTAVNSSGESGYSNEASATPMPPPPPPAPTGLTATAGDQQVSLSWNASAGAEYYHVKRATTAGGPYTHAWWSGTTSFVDSGLTNGTTYYYVVTAVNSGGESPNSSEVSAAPTGPPPPAAPTNLTATAGKRKVTLKWTQSGSSGVTQNRVYGSTTSGGPYTAIATIPAGTSYTDTSVVSRTTYHYVVTAVNSSGKESAFSNQASAKPK